MRRSTTLWTDVRHRACPHSDHDVASDPALDPATPELGKKIIDDVSTFSAPFGTKIEFKDGIGVVALGGTRSDQ